MKRRHILKETPGDRYCKKILKDAQEAKNLLWMRDWQLEDEWWRQRVKSNLLDAKPIINKCFSTYRKMIMRGYELGDFNDEQLENIKKGFYAIRKAVTKFEGGKTSPSKGMLNKKTFPMAVKKYRNLLMVILDEIIVESVKDAADTSGSEEEFYRELFKRTWEWAGTMIFKVWSTEGGREDGEEFEGEKVEEVKPEEFAEEIGEIA